MKKTSLTLLLLIITTSAVAAIVKPYFINVGSQKYSVLQAGIKKPTIIFLNGAGDTLETWNNVFSRLNKAQHFFAYDRAGTGESSPLANQTTPRTAVGVVTRLRKLLNVAKLKPPYVLVAHSVGSLYALYFARAYPSKVKAMVLVGPNVDAMLALGKIKNLNEKQQTIVGKLTRQINYNFFNEKERFLNYRGAIKHTPTAKEAAQIELYLENLGKIESQKEIDRLPPLKNMPLMVMSGEEGATQYDQMRRLAAKVISQSVRDGQYRLVKKSSHYVQKGAPAVVVAAIQKTL